MRCFFSMLIMVGFSSVSWAAAPTVTNVSAVQRTDGSGLVDVYYTLADPDGDACEISVVFSNNGGSTWSIIPSAGALSGDVGELITPGNKHLVWASKTDVPGTYVTNYGVQITADDGVQVLPHTINMEFVTINDSGEGMKDLYGNSISHGGFDGEMSKYETTNSQYCQFLNAALADGLIVMYNHVVYASTDVTYSEPYCGTYPSRSWSQILFIDGTFIARTRDGYDMAKHPVIGVSFYGATAFADYYGYRLPTEWEWQAVADYDGSYVYGCGLTINNESKANYYNCNAKRAFSNPLSLSDVPFTSPVGYYPAYGYGLCDMAGNVAEWTSSKSSYQNYQHYRDGSWGWPRTPCFVSDRSATDPGPSIYIGFRVCR